MVFLLLKFAIQDFLDDRKFKNVSKTTMDDYKMQLGQFLKFCNDNKIVNVEDITQSTIKNFIIFYQKKVIMQQRQIQNFNVFQHF